MTVIIILSILLGGFLGYFTPSNFLGFENILVEPILILLIFFAGLSIGYDVDIRETIKKIGAKIFILPIAIALGTIIGGMVAGLILGMDIFKSSAVASGLGWYSLSAVILSKYDASLGAMAMLSNVFRELLSFVVVPLVAKYIGYDEAIAPCGATSMDTTLGVVSRYTDDDTSLLSFSNGVIMIILVPILVQFFIGLAYGV